jgi:membrane fusion protein (multidrug efflux system)
MNKTPVLGCLLLVVLSAIGCNEKPAAKAASGGPAVGPAAGTLPAPARLAAVVLERAPASTNVTAAGTVLAEQEVNVETEIAGRVTAIGFREGGPVKAGQVLVELDGAELKAAADRAEATRLLARAQADRARGDYKAQAVSREELDRVLAEWKAAEADAALARARWEKTRIRAPFAGTAGLREVELGTVVQPGTRVTSLQNLSSLRVEFSVPEKMAGSVRSGMKISFTASGTPDTLEASVYAVESRVDPGTRLLRVRARTAGVASIPPGAFARVELPLRADSALWVPAEAVVQSARGSQVWRARGGNAEPTVFTPGLRSPTAVEAAAGLAAGDTIFVSGLLQLRPGAPAIAVIAKDSAAPAAPRKNPTGKPASSDPAPHPAPR